MTLLLRDRPEAPPATESTLPAGEQSDVLWRPCEACGERMRNDQDWCLECGGAAAGRLGSRPGWRSALTVVGLTLLLLTAVVAASYAALTGDAQREASRPSAGDGAPIVAQAPPGATPVTPGATGPGTTAPPVRSAPAPAHSAAPATSTPPSSGAPPSSSGPASGAGGGPSSPPPSGAGSSTSGPTTIKLAAATTYDPSRRAGAEFGPAGNAIDASAGSVWDVTVPADNQPIGAGLVVDLGASYKVTSLTIDTPTAGFDMELYGTQSKQIPPDILDGRWDHLANRKAYADGSSIALTGAASAKLRYISLWFTNASHADDPRIAIANVAVTGTATK